MRSIKPLHILARELGLQQTALREAADAGRIPFVQVGRHRLFNTEAVERALAAEASKFNGEEKQ